MFKTGMRLLYNNTNIVLLIRLLIEYTVIEAFIKHDINELKLIPKLIEEPKYVNVNNNRDGDVDGLTVFGGNSGGLMK